MSPAGGQPGQLDSPTTQGDGLALTPQASVSLPPAPEHGAPASVLLMATPLD